MAGPWEAFQTQAADAPRGPWEAFQEAAQPSEPSRFDRAARFVDNVVRQTARGATLGFADEIAAGARSLGGENYSEALAQERDRDSAFQAENPITALGAQFVGGVLSPVSRVLPGGQAATMPQAILRGATGGAIAGGAAGFGEGEGGFLPRAISAAQGAALGGVVGGALPVAVQGGVALARRAGRALGLTSPQTNAQRIVLRDLERDGMTPEELAANARQPGPTALADLGGENVLGTAAAVARQPGTGRQMAMDMVAGRGGETQANRLAEAVRGNVSADDFTRDVAGVIERRAAEAAPLYERAYSRVLPRDLRLQRFLNDNDVRAGIRAGIDSARREALTEDRAFDLAELGVQVTRRRVNGRMVEDIQLQAGGTPTRLFDAAKRGLDEMIEASRGENGRATSRTWELSRLRDAMLREVDRLNPDFAAARAAYAGQSELLDAATLGRELLSMPPRDFAARLQDVRAMGDQQRDFLRLGLAREMLDRIAATTDAQELTRLNRTMGTAQARERIRAVLGNDEEFGRFMREFAQEMRLARTNQAVNPRAGSQTMPLQERAADMANPPPGPVGASVVRPDPNAPPSPLQSLLMPQGGIFPAIRAVGQGLDRAAAIRDREALAPLLFATDPAARVRNAEALIARAQRDATLQRALTPTLQGLARGGAVVAAPSD